MFVHDRPLRNVGKLQGNSIGEYLAISSGKHHWCLGKFAPPRFDKIDRARNDCIQDSTSDRPWGIESPKPVM